MKVYVNDRNEIKAVGETKSPELMELVIDDENNPFNGWSDAKICCYKVQVDEGRVVMMTPYVDSRLIEHFNGLGTDVNTLQSNVVNVDDTLCELFEMILGILGV